MAELKVDPGLQQVVLESLDSEDPNVLRAACVMAGKLKLKGAERGLLRALSHRAWQIRLEAVKALGMVGSKGSLPFLKRMLKASDQDLRQRMLSAAGGRGQAPGEGDEEVPPELERAAAIAYNRIDPAVTEEVLLNALNSDQPNLIGAALAGLSNLESFAGRDRMIGLFTHQDPAVRKGAATAIGKLREKEGLAGLIQLLEDDDPQVRKEALIALNALKEVEALEHIADKLKDGDAEVRRVAAIALGNTRSGSEKLVGLLRQGLADRSPEVRAACLSALGNMRDTKSLMDVAGMLKDTHEDVSRAAAGAVITISALAERGEYHFDNGS